MVCRCNHVEADHPKEQRRWADGTVYEISECLLCGCTYYQERTEPPLVIVRGFGPSAITRDDPLADFSPGVIFDDEAGDDYQPEIGTMP